uniref:Guanosine polyphosphate pyrophosphohydrolases/synthetases n=1 Tax=uncultured marine thaumarchaeote KM3_66_E12 TaxID=1456229 RepID=A0A075HIF3_9ARCH|nr:Guanosine polyphosphate pyrophosphohydrolases/synthetases [uncultured marine thaumarchaeote KM3_66_E12]
MGQLRKNGKTTTFSHLKDVVRNLKKMKVTNEEIICAAWLHDTIEDTDTDYDSIKDRFGKNIAEIVVSVTKDNRLPKKQREIKYLKDLKASSAKAKLVKIADILANVNDAPNAGRNAQWEKQQFVKKSKYWNYVSGVKPGKLAELSWANDEWDRLQEKYN